MRRLTAILYCNSDWDLPEDGGALRCFLGAQANDDIGVTATCVRDISPQGGRLVLFDSQKILHQVLPPSSGVTAKPPASCIRYCHARERGSL